MELMTNEITNETMPMAVEDTVVEEQDLAPVDTTTEYSYDESDWDVPEEDEPERNSNWKSVGKNLAISGVSAGIGYLVGRRRERKANAKRIGVDPSELKPVKEKKEGFIKRAVNGIKGKIHSMTAPKVVAEVESKDVTVDSPDESEE